MPTFSNGWLHGFQVRRGIQFRKKRRQTADEGEDAAAEMATIFNHSQRNNEQRAVDDALHLFPHLFPQIPAADALRFLGRSQEANGPVVGQSQVVHEPVDQLQQVHEPVAEVANAHTPPKISAAEALEIVRMLLL